MQDKIKTIKEKILAELKQVKDSESLKDLEVKYLGRKGEFTKYLRQITELSTEQRKEIGQLANQTKQELVKKFSELRAIIEGEKNEDFVDVTLPGQKISGGNLHPLTIVQQELEDLFSSMGFLVLDGPELESDYYNFESLNIPADHPARDMQDTFYVEEPGGERGRERAREGEKTDLVMRTHTSPMQVRAMQKYGAPLRCVVPGRAFRCEALDACHEHTFYQMEGLMIGRDISLINLISVMKELINGIFKKEMKTRVRPGYFPFVEPGIEMDINCTICGGEGCPSCKYSGWLELMPAGMIHPNVLKYGGIDSSKNSGFAFGLGMTRLLMMKYNIEDIRLIQGGDLRFLKQFK